MKKLKKVLRVMHLVFLISIATIGIGLTGGIPIIPVYKKDDGHEIKIERVEPEKKKDHSDTLKI